jgi:cell division septation protein DedD
MKRKIMLLLIGVVFATGLVANNAYAEQEFIVDILTNPARYWNMTVTVVGDVQAVVANPPGTTRGTYTVLDDSCPNPLTVQTRDLPPIGRAFQVTGVVVQDPNQANVPMLRELSRAAPGMSSTMRLLLYGGGALFLILLIIFIILLAKPKGGSRPVQTARPMPRPTQAPVPPPAPAAAPRPVDPSKTTKVATTTAPPPPPDKTQVFMSLGAEILVDKGPDQGKDFALHKQVSTIGRPGTRKNDIEIGDDTVSKEQASIYYDAATKVFTLTNESMTNPTKLNGAMLTESAQLNDGDKLEMGRSILVFKKQ